jgi:N-methylhydantoinase B
MTVDTDATTVSPVTYQVLRNRMLALTEEMRIALQSVSGSPTVTEASDFFTGLFTPDGSTATMGLQVSFQAPVCGTLIRYVSDRPSMVVRDGDMFIGNDPYIGALHQNDVQMVGPIFVGDEILCWAGVEAHETDVGGMDFASWCPKARDVYQEGFRIPAVKLVDRGETREDVLDMILTASRLPDQLGLDIAAFIATINVARDRILALVDRYGIDTIRSVMKQMLAESSARLRHRVAQLPDGVIRATDFLEHDGHTNVLYKIDLKLTKKGEELTFDFSGTSEQAPGFINCTRAGLEGAVTGALLSTLAWDIAWNQGVMEKVKIIAPDGLLCTARFPAPVGAATVEAIWCIANAVNIALGKLLACSDECRFHAQAVGTGAMAALLQKS